MGFKDLPKNCPVCDNRKYVKNEHASKLAKIYQRSVNIQPRRDAKKETAMQTTARKTERTKTASELPKRQTAIPTVPKPRVEAAARKPREAAEVSSFVDTPFYEFTSLVGIRNVEEFVYFVYKTNNIDDPRTHRKFTERSQKILFNIPEKKHEQVRIIVKESIQKAKEVFSTILQQKNRFYREQGFPKNTTLLEDAQIQKLYPRMTISDMYIPEDELERLFQRFVRTCWVHGLYKVDGERIKKDLCYGIVYKLQEKQIINKRYEII
jgi:hypothetical protein